MTFVAASVWYTLFDERDQGHLRARSDIFPRLKSESRLITTNWVEYEAYSLLKGRMGYHATRNCMLFLDGIRMLTVYRVNDELEAIAMEMFWHFRDKRWGVTDCVSIALMRSLLCERVIAYDRHFHEAARQFGFQVLDGVER